MCGRFAQTQTGSAIAEALQLSAIPDLKPRYNIAPTQTVSVVTQTRHDHQRELHPKRWGLIPRWAKDASIGSRLINARSETVAEKPAFRDAFQKRRCLVIADGFYEWQRSPQQPTKQPYLIQLETRSPFAFAGLWERWRDPETQAMVFSCTLLTTQASDWMAPIHHRMPVILNPQDYGAWLDPTFYNPGALEQVLHSRTAMDLTAVPITSAVNNPRNDSPEVQIPVTATEQ